MRESVVNNGLKKRHFLLQEVLLCFVAEKHRSRQKIKTLLK